MNWHDAKTVKPDECLTVLCWGRGNYWLASLEDGRWLDDADGENVLAISHWMDLPEPPKIVEPVSNKELPEPCWVRYPGGEEPLQIVSKNDAGFFVRGIASMWKYHDTASEGWLFSGDKKTWKPFNKAKQ